MKSIKKKTMTKPSIEMDLQASLVLKMNHHIIKIECTGKSVKLIFSSFRSLVTFIFCYRNLKKNYFYLMEDCLSRLDFTYYLGNKLIGESNSHLPFSWLGRYFGIEKSQFYPNKLLSYFFNKK